MDKTLENARIEAIQEISRDILKVISIALERHGDDPMSEPIVSAALGLTIDKIDKNISIGFRKRMILLLDK